MSTVHIEWGDVERTESIEQYIQERSVKLFTLASDATKLVVHFQIINPQRSSGVATQKVSMELRLPHHQDLRAEQEGDDLYRGIRETKSALLAQLEKRKGNIDRTRAADKLGADEGNDAINDDEDHDQTDL